MKSSATKAQHAAGVAGCGARGRPAPANSAGVAAAHARGRRAPWMGKSMKRQGDVVVRERRPQTRGARRGAVASNALRTTAGTPVVSISTATRVAARPVALLAGDGGLASPQTTASAPSARACSRRSGTTSATSTRGAAVACGEAGGLADRPRAEDDRTRSSACSRARARRSARRSGRRLDEGRHRRRQGRSTAKTCEAGARRRRSCSAPSTRAPTIVDVRRRASPTADAARVAAPDRPARATRRRDRRRCTCSPPGP